MSPHPVSLGPCIKPEKTYSFIFFLNCLYPKTFPCSIKVSPPPVWLQCLEFSSRAIKWFVCARTFSVDIYDCHWFGYSGLVHRICANQAGGGGSMCIRMHFRRRFFSCPSLLGCAQSWPLIDFNLCVCVVSLTGLQLVSLVEGMEASNCELVYQLHFHPNQAHF